MEDQLVARIVDLLESERICNVATCVDDRPLNSAVEYVNAGTMLYFVSFPGTLKIANIKINPQVALTINASELRPGEIRGLQIFGRARILPADETDPIKTLFLDRNLLEPATHWSLENTILVEVAPLQIDYLDYSKGIGHKEIWTP